MFFQSFFTELIFSFADNKASAVVEGSIIISLFTVHNILFSVIFGKNLDLIVQI